MARIAIDYTPAYEQGGGIGRLVRDLISALAVYNQAYTYRLFVAGVSHDALPPVPGANFTWASTRLSPQWLARIWQRARIPLPVETFTGEVDLYHATDFVLPPTRKRTRTIVTTHDLSFVRVPEAADPRLKAYLDIVVPRSVRRADHVIADSAATKRDLIDLYQLPPDKITVLLSGVNPGFRPVTEGFDQIRIRYTLPERPYIFSIGTVQPRKNYARIVQALANLHQQGVDIDLVIAGGKGWLEGPLYQTIAETGMSDHVHMIGFARDEDIPALYTNAICVAFPSLYEGFGFPVLEAMACGTPVVTSNVSSLPEVAGDVAIMIDPYDVEALTDALHTIIHDQTLREQMIASGFEHIRQFTWQSAAESLVAIYNQVIT